MIGYGGVCAEKYCSCGLFYVATFVNEIVGISVSGGLHHRDGTYTPPSKCAVCNVTRSEVYKAAIEHKQKVVS